MYLVLVVFHHDEGVAQIPQALESSQQLVIVPLVQANGRFIQNMFEKKQYDEVNTVCDKIIAIGGELAAEAYAKKADCYFWPAQAIVEENSTLSIEDPKYNTNEEKIKALYEQAKPLYEKAKELEPDNKNIWGQFLLNIYWKLNKAEYEALEKEMGY